MEWRWVLAVIAISACGGDDHPDTGYGKDAIRPASPTCVDVCSRVANCAVALCNEDSSSHDYDQFEDESESQCALDCDQATLDDAFTAEKYDCIFAESCRAVFDDDVCSVGGTYSCTDPS
ncbi:MAG TPA: hypothetical protein VGM39_06335 [Kofleriaceae bacterium]|jgi:hypothetical protein